MIGVQRGVIVLQLAENAGAIDLCIMLIQMGMLEGMRRRCRLGDVFQPGSRVPAPSHEHGQEQPKHESDPEGLAEHLGL
ncbi:hypothetical protein D9M71_766270 [compost metagenome]